MHSLNSSQLYVFIINSPSTLLWKIEENDARRIADGSVMTGKVETAAFAVHTEDGDVVTSLIATIEELADGVEIEASRIAPACPFFPDIGQRAFWTYGKNPDAVVEPVASIDKPA